MHTFLNAYKPHSRPQEGQDVGACDGGPRRTANDAQRLDAASARQGAADLDCGDQRMGVSTRWGLAGRMGGDSLRALFSCFIDQLLAHGASESMKL